jgi:hypothetical protein
MFYPVSRKLAGILSIIILTVALVALVPDSKPVQAHSNGTGPSASQYLALLNSCSQISNGLYKTDTELSRTIPVCQLNGAVWWKADMDIDCDGKRTAQCSETTDPWFLPDTALHDSAGQPLDSAALPYVVVPSSSTTFNYSNYNIQLGADVAVIHNGIVEYGVFGDTGPVDIIGEASYKMAQNLGINPDPANGGSDGPVYYIVFKGSKITPVEDHNRAVTLGESLGNTLLANNGGGGNPTATRTNTPVITNTPVLGGNGSPYGGTARAIPGTIQAEDYNTGGQSVAWNDTTAGNTGGVYRADDVDVQATTDTGGGYNIGWVAVGEWTKYTVSVGSAGTYTIDFRVSSTNTTGRFHLEVDGANVTGTLAVPNTGSWQTFVNVTKTGVSLSAGQHVLRLYTEATGMNYNWIKFTAAGGVTNTPTKTPTCACITNTPIGATATRTPTRTPTTSTGVAAWAPGISYAVGQLASYGGVTYRCIQAHTSQVGWEPPSTPALWTPN